MKSRALLTFALSLCGCAVGSSSGTEEPGPTQTPTHVTAPVAKEMDVRTSMHDAFEDEAQWSRLYILHAFGRTSDLDIITTRLMSAEDAIATAMRPFYGSAFADSLSTLLHERANALIGIVTAVTGSVTTTAELRSGFYANASQIAALVESASPGISDTSLTANLYGGVRSLLDQIEARTHQEWVTDAAAFESTLTSEMGLADALTDTMVRQFLIVPASQSAQSVQLHFSLRQLIDDDAFWTRDFIVAHIVKSSDEPVAIDAAVKATVDIGAAFANVFGGDVGDEVARQLHLVTITDGFAYVYATELGSDSARTQLDAQWTSDGAALAQYLGTLGPWSSAPFERLLAVWHSQMKAEIEARFARDWQGDVDAYDAVLGNARTLANVIADGL